MGHFCELNHTTAATVPGLIIQLARDALYPQAVSGRPRRSENAKHVVKLLLNGAWRGVSTISTSVR